MTISVHDVEESHNIGVVHLLEKRDLANGSTGNSLIFGLKTDLLKCDDSAWM